MLILVFRIDFGVCVCMCALVYDVVYMYMWGLIMI